MAVEYKLSYTGAQINAKLNKIDNLAEKSEIPTKTSDLTNDSGYITSSGAPVQSVNGKTGAVSLNASDVGALPNTTAIPSKLSDLTADSTHRTVTDTEKSTWNAKANVSDIPTVPTKVSAFENDKGYLTAVPSEYVTETELTAKGYLTEHQDISGKLDASALPTAINTALAQAKANGEFDGEPGKDGTSVTHSWNGTTLTITSASGTSSADLKCDSGDSGAIIDVLALPETDIKEGVFYRLTTATAISGDDDVSVITTHCVDGLPEVGIQLTADQTTFDVYYNSQDNSGYGYISEMLAQHIPLALSVGWYALEELAPVMGVTYGGVTHVRNKYYDGSTLRILLTKSMYIHDDGWKNIPYSYASDNYEIRIGDLSEGYQVASPDGGEVLRKVSDWTPNAEELIGCTYKWYNDSSPSIISPADVSVLDKLDFGYYLNGIIVVQSLPAIIGELEFEETGMYFQGDSETSYVLRLVNPHAVSPIDPKFIPVDAFQEVNVQSAINTALAKAKASGEFKGDKGEPGTNGTSATHSWNGTTLTITSASGTSSADLKGDPGPIGPAPVKGVDYFTEADKTEMIQTVIDEIETSEEELPYTNVLPLALAADGVSIYNVDDTPGYKKDTRWSTSQNTEQALTGTYITGYIPVKAGNVIYLKNVKTDSSCMVHFFKDDFSAEVGSHNPGNLETYNSAVWDSDGNLIQFSLDASTTYTHCRIQCTYIGDDSIITINEEITEDELEVRVSNIETTVAELDTRLTSLENDEITPYTNLLPTAVSILDINTVLTGDDGSVGYLNNTRWSGSGNEYIDMNGHDVSGLMPAVAGDIVRLKNITMQVDANDTHLSIRFHTKDNEYVTSMNHTLTLSGGSTNGVYDEDGNLIQFTVPNWSSDAGTIGLFCITCQDINEKSIITVNEEIPEDTTDVKVENLELAVAELDTRVTALESDNNSTNSSSVTDAIPEYWKEHLSERVTDIRTVMASVGKNKSAFYFYSDAHWNGNAGKSPMLLKYLYKYTPINKVNYGGDIVATESDNFSDMAYLFDSWRSAIRDLPHHHSVAGNHDDRNEQGHDHEFSKAYVYSFLLAPEETNDRVDGAELYYYIDDKCENTRYLYLDTACYDAHILSVEQAQFVVDALNSTPKNYHIVVIGHCWFNQNYDNFPTVTADGLTTTTTKLLELFGAYNNRASGTLTPLGNASNNGSVSYDFTNANAKVEFCIGGHLHNDYNKTFNGIPVILCEADTMHNRNGSVSKAETISEQCITAVIADYANSNINLIRIGRGNSFIVNMDSGETTTYYSITNNLTNATTSSDVTRVVENESYNATITATVGALTSVVVTMGGTDVTSTVYEANTGTITISAITGDVIITAVAQSTTSYTNVIKTSIGIDGNTFNSGKGWAENSRIGSGKLDSYIGGGSAYITGHIEIDPTIDNTIRLRNVTFDSATTNTSVGIAFYDASFTRVKPDVSGSNNWSVPSGIATTGYGYDAVLEGTNIVQFTFDKTYHLNNPEVKYIAICAEYIGDDSIITINEPIEETSYDNVILQSVGSDGKPFNGGKGWAAESRIGSGGIYMGGQPADGYVTGHIPITVGIDNVIRLKNVTFDSSTNNNWKYMVAFFDSSFTRVARSTDGANSIPSTDFADYPEAHASVLDGNNVVEFTLSSNWLTNTAVKYIAICCSYLGDDSIITINQPITD